MARRPGAGTPWYLDKHAREIVCEYAEGRDISPAEALRELVHLGSAATPLDAIQIASLNRLLGSTKRGMYTRFAMVFKELEREISEYIANSHRVDPFENTTNAITEKKINDGY